MPRIKHALTLLLLAAAPAHAADACLHYGETVELVGHVVIHVFPALPGDTDNKLDPDTLLKLDEPLCVSADAGDPHNRAETHQIAITVLGSKDLTPRSYRSRHVVMAGTLFHGYLPEHRTTLMMNVTAVTVIPPPQRPQVEKVDHHFKAPPDNHWKQPAKAAAKPKAKNAPAAPAPSFTATPVDTGPPPLSTPAPGEDYLQR